MTRPSDTGKKTQSSSSSKPERSLKKSVGEGGVKKSTRSRSTSRVFSALYDQLAAQANEEGKPSNTPFVSDSKILEHLPPRPAPPPVNPVTIDLNSPKEVLSKAQRRRLKKPLVVISAEDREQQKEKKKEERRMKRMIKSNGGRRKMAKLREKRAREESACEEALQAFDDSFQPRSKGRRLER